MYKFKIDDFNRNDLDELIFFDYVRIPQTKSIYFYEYGDGFNFTNIKQIERQTCVILGTGDLDADGNRELFGADSLIIWLMEQKDSLSFPDSITWESDSTMIYCKDIGITNKLKGDGVDRIYGAGIPWLSTASEGYGWFYFTCTGDNQYEILNTFEESTRVAGAMDIGVIDNDSLTDVVITSPRNYLYFYESVDLIDTNFIKQDSLTEGGYASEVLLILPDIDRDGTNEIMKYQINYLDLTGYVSYGYLIYEDTSGTGVYDTIWKRDFVVGTDFIYQHGGDIDYGDMDGDGLNELVICGGRHIEVWESIGDNQFERKWEWTDPTYYTIQSFIGCHDFDKNGIDEIIFSGIGQSGECTRIFECDTTREPSAPEIISAEASDGVIVEGGVDYDDYIRIEFDGLTNEPYINKSNIDSILRLSGGHSYLANGRYLDTCRWEIEEAKSVLYVELTQILSSPTVAVGDTIYPDGITIRSFEYPSYAVSKPIVITGSFGPAGSGEDNKAYGLSNKAGIQIESQQIIWNTTDRGVLIIYDISGREIIKEETARSGRHRTDIGQLNNGIYFVKVKEKNQTLTKKMVKIR